MKISVVQFNASADKDANLARIEPLIEQAAARDDPDMIVLPEVSACISGDSALMREMAEPADGRYATTMAGIAARLGRIIHCGSFVEQCDGRYFNTSLVFDRGGGLIGCYRKIHRFDVVLPDGTEMYESHIVDRGDEIVVLDIEGVKVGLSICYDLRFAELFRGLVDKGATLIVLPAAFTFQTGADHWEVLLRARAIETQCYVAAAGQSGTFGGGKYMNFGHSMIVDPWGQVIAQVSGGEGHATGRMNMDYLASVRAKLPVQQHRVL